MTYDPTWIRKSPILIPQAVQNEALTAQKGSVRLDALEWGQKVGATTIDNSKSTGTALSMAPFNNNKMFVAWSAGTEGRYSIIDSSGNADSTAAQVFEAAPNFLNYQYGIATQLLPNGNVVLAYGQDQGANNALVFKIYDENGDVVRDTVTVKTHATETQWGVGLAALPDGSIVVTWQEAAAGSMSYFAIYDMDGDIKKGYTSLGGNYSAPQPAPLSDGNWIVTYVVSGTIYFRTYDRLGIQILGQTVFRTGVTGQATGLVTMGNGQIVVPFSRGFGVLDRQGNVVVAPAILEGAGTYAVSVLPHGNIVAQNNNGTAAKYKIYDSEGTLLNSEVTYDTAGEAIANGDVATFKNGNFMLAYVTASGLNQLKVFVHQGTKAGFGGDLSIEGALSLAAGASVSEISTDGTLAGDSDNVIVTEKGIKTYVDAQVTSTNYRIFDGDSEVAVFDDALDATTHINIQVDSSVIGQYTSAGLALGGGVSVATTRNDHQMGGYNGADGSQTALTTEYAARQYVDDITSDQNEPTGFPAGNSNTQTLIGIDGSNSVYIEPTGASYDVFLSGQRWRLTTKQSVTISDVEGPHYIYIDTDGVLKETTIFNISILYTKGYVAVAYWDAVNKEIVYFGDERHGCTMDGKTHANIHLARGTLYFSGLALADITPDGTGATNAEAQFSSSAGVITDEDITHTIPTYSFPANVPVFYLTGAGALWRKQDASPYPFVNTGTGRVGWNKNTAGTWSIEEVSDNGFVLAHIFATNDVNGSELVALMGQAEYANITLARAGAADEINSLVHGSLPFAEFHPVATLIYETSDSFTNTPKAIVRTNEDGDDWTDWRTSGLTPGSGSVTDHGSLSGLGNDDHLQYYRVDGFRDITGNLTVNGTSTFEGAVTAEAAVEAQLGLDVSGGTLQVANGTTINEFSIDGTLAGDSDDALPTEQAVKTYVDTAISNLNPDKIWEGDSYVEVIDDGTNAGYITTVADGVEVIHTTSTEQTFGAIAGSHLILTDSTASVPLGSVEAFGIDENGISVENGVTVNEFSNDGTLADESATSLPTEYAVKTYVDAQIGGAADKIWEGDSYVEVVDDGTNAGYVTIVTDGVEVANFDAEATSVRIGKASGAGRVVVTDTEVNHYIAATQTFWSSATRTVLGLDVSTATRIDLLGTAARTYVGSTAVLQLLSAVQTMGHSGTTIATEQTGDTITATANSVEVMDLAENVQRVGVAADTFLSLTQDTNTVDLRANNVSVLNATDTTQRFGASGDTALTLNTGADTFTLSAGAITQVSGSTTAITLGVAGDTTILMDSASDQVAITAGGQSQLLVETSGTTVYDDLTVTGDLFVDGTTFVVNQTHVQTADNIITVNYGEPGAGVTAGSAGIEVDRGTLPNYEFLFFENTDTFRVGETGTTQAVATREDSPTSMIVPWWNSTANRFDTAGSSSIAVNTTTDVITMTAASSAVATFESDGLTLASGTNINEFSIDGTLAGDSDDAVPTEKAVKTYVDAQIGGVSNTIFQGDSHITVYDDGTAQSYAEVVINGTQVQYWDDAASSIRLGKEAETHVLIVDASLKLYDNTTELANFNTSIQRIGLIADTYLQLQQGSNQMTFVAATGGTVMTVNDVSQTFGVTGATNLIANQSTNTVTIDANAVEVLDLTDTNQRLGTLGDTYINLTSTTATIGSNGTVGLYILDTVQRFGVNGDTYIQASQAGDLLTFNSAGVAQATIGTGGLTLFSGESVNEFSSDGTLAGDSDDAIPTEKAVKSYVDTAIANLNPDKIWEGDSYVEVVDDGTNAGYVTIVADGVEVAHYDAEASSQRMGKASGAGRLVTNDSSVVATVGSNTVMSLYESIQLFGLSGTTYMSLSQTGTPTANILANNVNVLSLTDDTQTLGVTADTRVLVNQTNNEVTVFAATGEVASFDTLGLQLGGSGARVTTISTSTAMGSSDTTLITQGAATSYIDTGDTNTYNAAIAYADGTTLVDANVYTDAQIAALRNEVDLINLRTVTTDSTATTGDVILVDTTAGDVNIEMVVAEDSRIIVKKKTTDGNKVNISTSSGTVDGQNLIIIDTPYQSFTFVSDGSNFYII